MILLFCSVSACGAREKREPAHDATHRTPDTAARAPRPEPWRDTTDCARSYEGTINNTIAITMRLCRNGESLAGSYRYVKVGKDIEIQGHVGRDGEFILYEWGEGGSRKQTGNWLGRFSGDDVLEGTWSTISGDRSMPFHLTLAKSTSRSQGGFAGTWSYEKEGYTFTLDLAVRGDSIIGEHCAVTKNATRVDCSADEITGEETRTSDGELKNPSIRGTFSGTKATVGFESYYGVDSAMNPIRGRATMTLDNGRLAWKIIDFTPGDFYLPMEAVLKREGK
jgi:hypothetical protein